MEEKYLSKGAFWDLTFGSTILHKANLRNSTLNGANLIDANLHSADLTDANLSHANLSGANLSGADLTQVNFTSANLSHTNFSNALLSATRFAEVDLCSAKGLVEIKHQFRSFVELYSTKLPQDGSALHFLRGVGAPDEWIDFYHTTMMKPIHYYSCFISYSSADEILAKRLHADLQANGVRCWFALHDLKPGDHFREKIDKAIHIQEKLLLMLSKASVESRWVKYEVNRVLNREIEQDRTILFPIRLDDAILYNTSGWAADLHAHRHIGDFTRWEDQKNYQEAFTQLLYQLRTEAK